MKRIFYPTPITKQWEKIRNGLSWGQCNSWFKSDNYPSVLQYSIVVVVILLFDFSHLLHMSSFGLSAAWRTKMTAISEKKSLIFILDINQNCFLELLQTPKKRRQQVVVLQLLVFNMMQYYVHILCSRRTLYQYIYNMCLYLSSQVSPCANIHTS